VLIHAPRMSYYGFPLTPELKNSLLLRPSNHLSIRRSEPHDVLNMKYNEVEEIWDSFDGRLFGRYYDEGEDEIEALRKLVRDTFDWPITSTISMPLFSIRAHETNRVFVIFRKLTNIVDSKRIPLEDLLPAKRVYPKIERTAKQFKSRRRSTASSPAAPAVNLGYACSTPDMSSIACSVAFKRFYSKLKKCSMKMMIGFDRDAVDECSRMDSSKSSQYPHIIPPYTLCIDKLSGCNVIDDAWSDLNEFLYKNRTLLSLDMCTGQVENICGKERKNIQMTRVEAIVKYVVDEEASKEKEREERFQELKENKLKKCSMKMMIGFDRDAVDECSRMDSSKSSQYPHIIPPYTLCIDKLSGCNVIDDAWSDLNEFLYKNRTLLSLDMCTGQVENICGKERKNIQMTRVEAIVKYVVDEEASKEKEHDSRFDRDAVDECSRMDSSKSSQYPHIIPPYTLCIDKLSGCNVIDDAWSDLNEFLYKNRTLLSLDMCTGQVENICGKERKNIQMTRVEAIVKYVVDEEASKEKEREERFQELKEKYEKMIRDAKHQSKEIRRRLESKRKEITEMEQHQLSLEEDCAEKEGEICTLSKKINELEIGIIIKSSRLKKVMTTLDSVCQRLTDTTMTYSEQLIHIEQQDNELRQTESKVKKQNDKLTKQLDEIGLKRQKAIEKRDKIEIRRQKLEKEYEEGMKRLDDEKKAIETREFERTKKQKDLDKKKKKQEEELKKKQKEHDSLKKKREGEIAVLKKHVAAIRSKQELPGFCKTSVKRN
ncbi:hypothetical protein ADUPG1_011448, partial [Aduncisulcus paluster]